MNQLLRAILFVPASRPDRIPKALASGADLVCVDLEDAILADDKVTARQSLMTFLETGNYDPERLSVRVNDPTTAVGQDDLVAIADAGVVVETLLVPKAADTVVLDELVDRSPTTSRLIVLVESAAGLSNAHALASHPHAHAMVFGSADWSTEIGCTMSWDPLLYARSRIVHAAIEGGAIPVDGAWLDLDDQDGLQDDCRRLRDLGFRGRIALHPRQVLVIRDSFSPDDASVRHATRVLDAVAGARAGAFQVDGRIVDEPVIRRARQLLESMGIEHPAGKNS